jgi:hypothetical protein
MLRKLVALKIYFDRARVYIGYGQTLMIVVIFVNAVGWKLSTLAYALLFIAFIVVAVFIGWLDTKLKIREYEYENQSGQNPYITRIHTKVDRIEKILEKTIRSE